MVERQYTLVIAEKGSNLAIDDELTISRESIISSCARLVTLD